MTARPEVVQPQPVPVTVNVARANIAGDSVVVLQLHSFNGAGVYFLPVDFARQVAAMLQEHAGGIVVPTTPLLPDGTR